MVHLYGNKMLICLQLHLTLLRYSNTFLFHFVAPLLIRLILNGLFHVYSLWRMGRVRAIEIELEDSIQIKISRMENNNDSSCTLGWRSWKWFE